MYGISTRLLSIRSDYKKDSMWCLHDVVDRKLRATAKYLQNVRHCSTNKYIKTILHPPKSHIILFCNISFSI